MIILAIDTATEACSAAVWHNGTVYERFRLAPREHNLLILPMIDSILAESGVSLREVDALAFGRGPGSFTGVRIAAGVAQGIGFGADLPVVPVSTLAALASEALAESDAERVLSCIDARMGEVYCAVYRRGSRSLPESDGPETVTAPQSVEFPPNISRVGIGSGWTTYREILAGRAGRGALSILDHRFPRAAHVARMGADGFACGLAVPVAQALPVYLRDEVAKKTPVASD